MHGNANVKLLYIVPLMGHTFVVCIDSIIPMATGCFICVNISLVSVLIDISKGKGKVIPLQARCAPEGG